MPKRKETLELERALESLTIEKGYYGCEEITIGFVNNGHGHEIVDYMTMDSKGTIRCYEIKVTLQDLKSKAAKSWYGNYNYLVVSQELFKIMLDKNIILNYLPENVGLMVGQRESNATCQDSYIRLFTSVRAKKSRISTSDEVMLKESLVRSMYYKMCKYKDSKSIEFIKELQRDVRRCERELKQEEKENRRLYRVQWEIERLVGKLRGNRNISIEDIVNELYWKCKSNGLINDIRFF